MGKGFYTFYIAKDYDFVVEAPCDPSLELCYQRDCSNPSDCPPNELSVYKKYYVRAYDFARCSNNSCVNLCTSEPYRCRAIICGSDPNDSCVGPKSSDI